MKENVIILSIEEIGVLKKEFDLLTFNNDYDVIYENHIPIAGILIIEGQVELLKRSKVKTSFHASHLLGLRELIQNKPVKFCYRIKANSKIILLEKSKIIQSIRQEQSKLALFMKSYLF